MHKKGINVPLVYTKAYACYALKCAIAPDIPNNAGSLAPFKISAPIIFDEWKVALVDILKLYC